MAIECGRIRGTTAREMTSALGDGFAFDRGSGSHQIYRHNDGRVTVTLHGSGDTFAPKTLKSMIETEAKWTAEDLTVAARNWWFLKTKWWVMFTVKMLVRNRPAILNSIQAQKLLTQFILRRRTCINNEGSRPCWCKRGPIAAAS